MDQFDQNNLEFQWPLWGTSDLPKFVFLRTKLEDHISQIRAQSRQWHPTPVLLPGNPHGRRSLMGCRLWGGTVLDTTEAT